MAFYRKLPVIIEAIPASDYHSAKAFIGDSFTPCETCDGSGEYEGEYGPKPCYHCLVGCIHIRTLEGVMTADPDDFIIKGVKGEFYPCKPDIFAHTYELVDA